MRRISIADPAFPSWSAVGYGSRFELLDVGDIAVGIDPGEGGFVDHNPAGNLYPSESAHPQQVGEELTVTLGSSSLYENATPSYRI